MTLRLKAGAATDVGRVRQVNQDSFLVLDDRGLYAVADGMGGHQGGEVASQLAIEALRSTYVEGAVDALAAAIEEANLRIHEEGEADPNLQGMGTTVVAVAVVPDEQGDETTGSLLVANVGDSRAYLFRDDSLTQLTEDHSMVGDLLREGRITEAEAEVHPQRNIVTRVLGVYDQVDIDLWPVDAVRGDRLLLCSDGLFNEVAGDQIASVLRRLADPQEAAAELVRRAIEGGGRDNVTVLIVDVVDDGGVAQAASSSLAGAASALDSGQRDLAGFASARDEIIDAPEPERERRRLRRPKGERVPLRSRLTWRVAAFAILLLAVVGGAIATIQWYGTSAYYLGVQHGEVVIFQGRPGGVLWIDPKVVAHSGIQVAEVPDNYRDRLVKGREQEQSSRREADRVVSNIERDIAATTTTTTTTTLPPDPNAPTTVVAP
jgi:serine/threonine protein phosphatase PrpC